MAASVEAEDRVALSIDVRPRLAADSLLAFLASYASWDAAGDKSGLMKTL